MVGQLAIPLHQFFTSRTPSRDTLQINSTGRNDFPEGVLSVERPAVLHSRNGENFP
jgi:hypothetical protein